MPTIPDILESSLRGALAALGVDPLPARIPVERSNRPELGDWSSSVALATAKATGRKPRDLADDIASRLAAEPPPYVADVSVAGPGFVNFRLHDRWLHDVLTEVVEQGTERYARHDLGHGERVNVEFVSANPTGPLHVGNGWWCSYGDALSRVLERCGWQVWREYYVNDTGGQVRQLGESLVARRRGDEVPEGGYQGAYVATLATEYDGPDDVVAAGRWAAERIVDEIRGTLDELGIRFDAWFSQASIEDSGGVEAVVEELRWRGLAYEKDDATWAKTTAFGDTRDRVLRKSNGDFTYLAGDLAYHWNKFVVRGFDRAIDIWGADHHGQVASLLAGMEALGIERGRLEIKLGQMVSLAEGRMSKRAGNFVPLSELVRDIGPDATRLLSLMSSVDQATTIDLELVRRRSMDNPVYYVQYAHARIASMARVAAERGVERRPLDAVDLSLLTHHRELDLLRTLGELPEVVADGCTTRAPHKVATWVRELAGRFHGFYHDCYVMGEGVGAELTQARLWLVEATRIALAITLELLGVSAPESM
ncbi:MAG: arginine--tRNA ligase [Actinomycetota bacterium]|nr:arginine--tRNA ligase [Actinomycetota bacterium]